MGAARLTRSRRAVGEDVSSNGATCARLRLRGSKYVRVLAYGCGLNKVDQRFRWSGEFRSNTDFATVLT